MQLEIDLMTILMDIPMPDSDIRWDAERTALVIAYVTGCCTDYAKRQQNPLTLAMKKVIQQMMMIGIDDASQEPHQNIQDCFEILLANHEVLGMQTNEMDTFSLKQTVDNYCTAVVSLGEVESQNC